MKIKLLLILIVMILSNHFVNAQDSIVNTNPVDYTQPKDYILADISIKGIKFLSKSTITDISALKINQIISVPGNDISIAINKLWKQNLFSDIKIEYDKVINDSIYLNIILKEYPRLSKFKFKGDISKSNITTLKEDLKFNERKSINSKLN